MAFVEKITKVVLVGPTEVGKTSIVNRINDNSWTENVTTTIGGGNIRKEITSQSGVSRQLDIWDTAGQERYSSLLPIYIRDSNIILFVFDLANLESLENLKQMYQQIQQNNLPLNNCTSYLIGNKLDKADGSEIESDIKSLKNFLSPAHFFKVSAKENINIDQILKQIQKDSDLFSTDKTTNVDIDPEAQTEHSTSSSSQCC